MLGLSLHDWTFVACMLLLVGLIAASDGAQARGQGRPLVAAMLVAAAGLSALLLTTDTRDSVLFAGLFETQTPDDGKDARVVKVSTEDMGDDGRTAGYDPSGPGDGKSEGGELNLSLMSMPAPGGGGELRQGYVPPAGSRGGAARNDGVQLSIAMEGGGDGPPSIIEEEKGQRPEPTRQRDCSYCPDLIIVPPGTLTLGPDPDDPGSKPEDGMLRRIAIRKPFMIGRFEVTVEEFHAFVVATAYRSAVGCVADGEWRFGTDYASPGFNQSGAHPVVCVTWNDAKAYLKWLGKSTGRAYRLPSENEWEYAARAGKRSAGHHFVYGPEILESEANFGHRRKGTRPVGKYLPNKLGLFDVAGNAWELVEDCYEADATLLPVDASAHTVEGCTKRVMRGGAWYNRPGYLRLAARWANPETAAGNGVGFRVARDLGER